MALNDKRIKKILAGRGELTHAEIKEELEDIDYGLIDLFDRGLCYDQDDIILALRLLVEKTLEVEFIEDERK